jgi:DNA-binding response OmpR family regulator
MLFDYNLGFLPSFWLSLCKNCKKEELSSDGEFFLTKSRRERVRVVLLVEDNPTWVERITWGLQSAFTVKTALTAEVAREKFQQFRNDLVGIVIDSCLGTSEPNTYELVTEFRETFSGPIFVGAEFRYHKSFYDVGATKVYSKKDLAYRLKNHIRLTQPRGSQK